MENSKPNKKNRLTLYIIIALVIGIALGFVLNKNYLNDENVKLASSEIRLKELSLAIKNSTDTTTAAFRALKTEKVAQAEIKNASLIARDKLVEPFSILADIFLRLIKMIVAPLVFSTLVVGVAKVGDIKSVGRIGGNHVMVC